MPNFASEDRLTTVGSYLSPQEAEMLVAALGDEGIVARLEGDGLSTTLSYFGTAVGGTRVIVAEQHGERAEALLQRLGQTVLDDEPIPDGFDYGDDSPECPEEVGEAVVSSPCRSVRIKMTSSRQSTVPTAYYKERSTQQSSASCSFHHF